MSDAQNLAWWDNGPPAYLEAGLGSNGLQVIGLQ